MISHKLFLLILFLVESGRGGLGGDLRGGVAVVRSVLRELGDHCNCSNRDGGEDELLDGEATGLGEVGHNVNLLGHDVPFGRRGLTITPVNYASPSWIV